MSVEVHREPLFRRYYAPPFSGAMLYTIAFGVTLILLPLIVAYNSHGFWVKENVYYEQPNVEYKYKVFLQFNGYSSLTGRPVEYMYSTSPTVNGLYDQKLRIPFLQSAELDDNRDGVTDRIEINVRLPLANTEDIHSVTMLTYYDVALSDKVKYTYDAVTSTTVGLTQPISAAVVEGDLKIRQSWPLMARGGYRSPYSGDNLIEVTKYSSVNDFSFSSIQSKANARNLSLNFVPTYTNVQPMLFPAGTFIAPASMQRTLNFTAIHKIPIQAIRYTPAASEVLKSAWIQYIAFFAVISFVLFRINSFVFRHQLISTRSTADVVVEKLD